MVDVLVAEKYASLAPVGWILAGLLLVLALIFWRKGSKIVPAVAGVVAVVAVVLTWMIGVSWYSMDQSVEQDIVKAVSDEYKMSYVGADSIDNSMRYYYIKEGGSDMTECVFDLSQIMDEGIHIVTEPRGERAFTVKVTCSK